MCSWLRVSKEGVKKDNKVTEKEGFSLRNGGLLLEQLIASCDGKSNPIHIFSAKDLQKATNNYAPNQIFRRDGSYALYKGTHENRIISVKKFQGRGRRYWLNESIREVVIASQMNHGNMLKLLGCCLETEDPIPVFEFASNGVLFDHIHEEEAPSSNRLLLSWERRLRIATGIADAVSYLHMAISERIIHRDVRPGNIFLDQNWVAKLSDFTSSVSIPLGETHVEVDRMRGAPGFIDPASFYSGRLTEKSDVYSFGMLLLELLTGHRAYSISREDAFIHDYVRPFAEKHCVSEIVASTILEGGVQQQQLQASIELALRCTKETAEERPTMMDVATILRQIQKV